MQYGGVRALSDEADSDDQGLSLPALREALVKKWERHPLHR